MIIETKTDREGISPEDTPAGRISAIGTSSLGLFSGGDAGTMKEGGVKRRDPKGSPPGGVSTG